MADSKTLGRAAILVVEDEALVRFCAADALEEKGFEVVEAANAENALKVLASRPDVKLLFTDIQLPGPLDGMDLARAVREKWPHIGVVITSGHIQPQRSDMPDGSSFIAKPCDPSELAAQFNRFLTTPEPELSGGWWRPNPPPTS
jgi:two-component system, response regulator PdtaR